MKCLLKEQRPKSRQQVKYLDLALKLAATSLCRNRHGAAVVKNGNILGLGINVDRNSPKVLSPHHIKGFASLHSEVNAIIKSGNCRGATIYIARVGRKGNAALSRPCGSCALAIEAAGIAKVIYTYGDEGESILYKV